MQKRRQNTSRHLQLLSSVVLSAYLVILLYFPRSKRPEFTQNPVNILSCSGSPWLESENNFRDGTCPSFPRSGLAVAKTNTKMGVVQSLNSPFFPAHIGAEAGRTKRKSRITCMAPWWKSGPDCHHHFDASGTPNAMFDELAERSLVSPLAGTKHTYVRLAIIDNFWCRI